MDQKFIREHTENNPKINIRRKFHKIRLEELQQYFDYNIFYLEDYDKNEDYDEELLPVRLNLKVNRRLR